MASKGVNKVILLGNLGADPDTRSFPDGSTVTTISLATSESWRDKNTGQMQDRTEWHRVVLRDRGGFRLGQIAGQYLKKGAKVYIEGSLRTRKWQNQQGIDQYTTEIIADNMQMLDSRNAGGFNEDNAWSQADRPAQPQAPVQNNNPYAQPQAPMQNNNSYAQSQGAAQTQPPVANYNDFDDDIPF